MWKLNKTDKNIIRQIILFVCFCVIIINPVNAVESVTFYFKGEVQADCNGQFIGFSNQGTNHSDHTVFWNTECQSFSAVMNGWVAGDYAFYTKRPGDYYPTKTLATVNPLVTTYINASGKLPTTQIGLNWDWNKDEYTKGETAIISVSFNSSNFNISKYNYFFKTVLPDGSEFINDIYSPSGNVYLTLSMDGVYSSYVIIYDAVNDYPIYNSSTQYNILTADTTVSFITFDQAQYTLGETGKISYGLSSSFWDFAQSRYIEIYKDSSKIEEIENIKNFGTYYYKFPGVGTYVAKYYTWSLTEGTKLRSESVMAEVNFEPSYLYVNASIPIKTEVNVSYFLGETNSNTDLENVIEAAYLKDNGQYVIEDSCYFSSQSETGSCFMNIDNVGTYLFTLKNLPLNLILDSEVVETYYVDLKPKYNFTTSGINVTKSPVYQGESIQGNYFVKGSMFNSSQIYIDAFNINQSFKYNTQLELLTDSGTFNMVMPEIRTGWNILFLNYTNSTGSGSLANVSFNVIGVNPSGYGLTLSSYNIVVGEDYSVNIILPPYPAKGKLIVVEQTYNEEIFNMSLNSSMSIPQKINIMGTYSYILSDNNNEVQVMRLLTVNPYPTPNETAIPDNDGESGTQSGRQMDGLVLLLGQGLTTESKLIFALVMMAIVIVGIYWSTKSQFIAIIGAGSWFIWMTIIEYIPIWVIIVIVIAMLIKGKFGGE